MQCGSRAGAPDLFYQNSFRRGKTGVGPDGHGSACGAQSTRCRRARCVVWVGERPPGTGTLLYHTLFTPIRAQAAMGRHDHGAPPHFATVSAEFDRPRRLDHKLIRHHVDEATRGADKELQLHMQRTKPINPSERVKRHQRIHLQPDDTPTHAGAEQPLPGPP